MLVAPGDSDSDGDGGGAADSVIAGEADAAELPAAVPRAGEQQQQRQPPTIGQFAARAQRDHAELHAKLMATHARIVAVAPLHNKDAIEFFEDVERKPDNKQQLKGSCMACGKVTGHVYGLEPVGDSPAEVPTRSLGDHQGL